MKSHNCTVIAALHARVRLEAQLVGMRIVLTMSEETFLLVCTDASMANRAI